MFAKFASGATEQDIHSFVVEWVGLLAAKNYQQAYESVLQSAYQGWTPDLMESVVNGYGSPFQQGQLKYEVTNINEARGRGDGFGVMWLDEAAAKALGGQQRLAEVRCQLPLNHVWSDLTVTFELLGDSDDLYLELADIHVS